MQEERYPTAANPMPFNMLLGKGYPREVFDEFIDPFEAPQARLKQPIPSNETICLPKDEVAKTCPQLLPPAPTMQPYGFCGAPLKNQAIGDGYIINYAEKPIGGSIFNNRYRMANKPRAWFFPAAPTSAMLGKAPSPKANGPMRIGRGPLKVGIFPQMGGAIGGINWRGQQLLALRPGSPRFNRQSALQVQIATNIPPGGHDRQRRANEAGGWWNQRNSSSKLLVARRGFNARNGRDVVFTRTQASYFHRPGRRVHNRRVLNTTELSPFQMTKRVGVGADFFKLRTGITVPAMERVTSMRLAAARFALKPSMNRVMAYHAPTRRWVSLRKSRTLNVGVYTAIAVTNASGNVAMGVSLTNFPKPPHGTNFRPAAYYAVNATNRPEGTLVAVVHKLGIRGAQAALPGNKTYAYHMHFQFGNLANVTRKLAIIANGLNRASQFLIVRKGWTPQRLRYACAPQRTRVVTRTVYVNAQGRPIRRPMRRRPMPGGRLPRPPMALGNAWMPRPGMQGMWIRVRPYPGQGQNRPMWMRQRDWMRELRQEGWTRNGRVWMPPKKKKPAVTVDPAMQCTKRRIRQCKRCKPGSKKWACRGCNKCTPKPKAANQVLGKGGKTPKPAKTPKGGKCGGAFPVMGKGPKNKGKCCVAAYSNKCEGSGGGGGGSRGGGGGKKGSSIPVDTKPVAGKCPFDFQTMGADGKCRGCPATHPHWYNNKCNQCQRDKPYFRDGGCHATQTFASIDRTCPSGQVWDSNSFKCKSPQEAAETKKKVDDLLARMKPCPFTWQTKGSDGKCRGCPPEAPDWDGKKCYKKTFEQKKVEHVAANDGRPVAGRDINCCPAGYESHSDTKCCKRGRASISTGSCPSGDQVDKLAC